MDPLFKMLVLPQAVPAAVLKACQDRALEEFEDIVVEFDNDEARRISISDEDCMVLDPIVNEVLNEGVRDEINQIIEEYDGEPETTEDLFNDLQRDHSELFERAVQKLWEPWAGKLRELGYS